MTEPYELGTAPPARRAIADRLPPEIAAAAVEFITGPLLANPKRVGKPLGEELDGICSARLGRTWRVLYEIDDTRQAVIVLDIRHRPFRRVGEFTGARDDGEGITGQRRVGEDVDERKSRPRPAARPRS